MGIFFFAVTATTPSKTGQIVSNLASLSVMGVAFFPLDLYSEPLDQTTANEYNHNFSQDCSS